MTVVVRPAVRSDARTIARIRIDTWHDAYDGLIPQPVLDQLDAETEGERRFARWDELHADPRGGEIMAEVDGEVAGWAAFGPSQDADLPRDGQLYAIYALAPWWGHGVGHALLDAVEQRLRDAGYRSAHLWVLDGNERAASFYERHGWVEDGATVVDERTIGGHIPFALYERRRVRDLTANRPPRG